MKIIVIDDEAGIRELISLTLQEDGHIVLEAEDGLQGLNMIRTEHPDLIISDLKMPKMNGDEMFNTLRSGNSDLGVIPFIFLSANVDESDRIKHLNGGADGCFVKPIHMSLLRAHVNACLASSKRHSDFLKRKMDDIAQSIPLTTKYDFDARASLAKNVDQYVAIINDSISALVKSEGLKIEADLQESDKPLDYVRYCLLQIDSRRLLVQSMSSEVLTWWLIFTVAESQYSNEPLYVSDLYVSATSAKTTINSRINMLVEEGVFEKHTPSRDRRRQNIMLSEIFNESLLEHISESLEVIRGVVS